MTSTPRIIDGFSLENILQIFSLEKKSQTLRVNCDNKTAFIDILNGEITNAELDYEFGVNIAVKIISWDNVQVELLQLRNTKKTIDASLINILMEASKLKDELSTKHAQSGINFLHSAIEKAEMHLTKESYNDLVQYIKINRNDAQGWLWYSRIQGNIGIMKKALKMATTIAPQDEEILEEQKKITIASPFLTNELARKCYFCWAPLNKKEHICHYCHGRLTINEETLTVSAKMDSSCLHLAQQRYQRILNKWPRNLIAMYCLALLHFNNDDYQEALGFLDKTAKMAPSKELFANQLKILLNHLARQPVPEIDDSTIEVPTPDNEKEPDQNTKKLILVVEDSSTTRKVIAITLSRSGYRVNEAADGLEALSKISEERPDLIMLDVILPKMDGYKILSIIKGNKEFRDIPVIMLTSKDGFISKMKGKMAGTAAYLTKPFDPEKMISEIEKHI